MTTYEVTAWCSLPHYTTFEVEAASIEEALESARIQVNDECPEPCNGSSYEWNEFELSPNDGGASLRHLEPQLAVEIAAREMLEALLVCEDALSDLARLDDGTPSVSALIMARDAIAKATNPRSLP